VYVCVCLSVCLMWRRYSTDSCRYMKLSCTAMLLGSRQQVAAPCSWHGTTSTLPAGVTKHQDVALQ